MVARGLTLMEADAMVEAIRDQWVVVVAVIVFVALVAWLWGGGRKAPRL